MNELRVEPAAFDAMAASYDPSFTTTLLGRYLRSVVWERFDACFTGNRRLLDIGCGTGEDAIYLAQRGHRVLAVDPSASMLEVAAEKAERTGCASRIEFRRLPMERIAPDLDGERFDGVCSNFGVINCAHEPRSLAADLAALVQPGAPLIWVVMGRYVPWEWAWYLARADYKRAFRRLPADGTSWNGLRLRYPTPRQLASALNPHFQAVRSRALGLLLPPSYAAGWLERRQRLFAELARIERWASGWQVLGALADHYIIEARRFPDREHSEAPQ